MFLLVTDKHLGFKAGFLQHQASIVQELWTVFVDQHCQTHGVTSFFFGRDQTWCTCVVILCIYGGFLRYNLVHCLGWCHINQWNISLELILWGKSLSSLSLTIEKKCRQISRPIFPGKKHKNIGGLVKDSRFIYLYQQKILGMLEGFHLDEIALDKSVKPLVNFPLSTSYLVVSAWRIISGLVSG